MTPKEEESTAVKKGNNDKNTEVNNQGVSNKQYVIRLISNDGPRLIKGHRLITCSHASWTGPDVLTLNVGE